MRLMTLIDEFSRRCLAIHVARRINALDVIETLADVMLFEGIPAYIRSDNGPEMVVNLWPCMTSGRRLQPTRLRSSLRQPDLRSTGAHLQRGVSGASDSPH